MYTYHIPSGKRLHNELEKNIMIFKFSKSTQLYFYGPFLSFFPIANCNSHYQRVTIPMGMWLG